MTSFRLTRRSSAELQSIYTYGVRQFGRNQSRHYVAGLKAAFATLATHPRMGRLAPDLGPMVRRHEHASHVILYREHEGGILVFAIVHGRSLHRLRL